MKEFLGAALVTGATSGIGAEVAKQLAARGYGVFVTGRREPAHPLPESMHFIAADHSAPDSAKQVAESLDDRFGPLKILVNNVGRRDNTPVTEIDAEFLAETMSLNTMSIILMIKELTPKLAETGGAIVNLSSRLSLVGMPGVSSYAASKGALNSFTVASAVELAPLNIRVNAVAAGMTRTPLIDTWFEEQDDPEATERAITASIPLGRLAQPDEIARAVVFLATPDSSYITGSILPVDGGFIAN